MTRSTLRINWPAIALAVAFLFLAGYQAMAVRHLRQLAPPIIATVDLQRVLLQTEERAVANAEVEQIVNEMRQQGEEQAVKIRALQEELELYAPGSDQHQAMLEELSIKTLEYQGFSEWARGKVEFESARRLSRLYENVKRVISEEAKEKGYDIVVVNDSLGLLRGGDEAEVTMQISARRLLYASPHLDITADVITRLNAAVQARGGG